MEGFPKEILQENWFINVEFLEDKIVEIMAREYLLSIAEIQNGV